MLNTTRLVIMVLLLLIVSLTACSPAPAPTTEPIATEPPEPTAASTPTSLSEEAQPATEQPEEAVSSGGNAYPAPNIEYVPYNPYPDPIEGEEIEWSQVGTLLQNEQISEVLQLYSLQIVITLEDGRTFLATAPAKDEIFKLLDECGNRCNRIRRLSEF